ncbi:hypothetical protein J5N97_013867 [Dioscorea zingiberensis]|uniref:Protein kinase domain-containing protein n=1 Tax=Dioscorea zingiberensis TaxID=325984 RepID=A0A9D5HJ89_9LILI|nr:hypothetical protein J5N97_013867 [Dioscorea zingiberensis]
MSAFSLFLLSLLLLFPFFACSVEPGLNDDVLGLIVFKADLRDPNSKLSSWNEDDDQPCHWPGVLCDPKSNLVTELSLSGFSLSGKIGFRGLLRLQSLKKLSLSKNNFSGALSPEILRLESLRTLDLSENSLSGPIPNGFFSQCRSLRTLSLANNAFSGEIPANVGSCSTLAAMNLSSNQLSGALPPGLWDLNALRMFDLSDNLFSGEVPFGVHRMFNLRTISLRGNRLSGRLPEDIGSCLLLKRLDLGRNSFSGDLPVSLRRLSMCQFLSLNSNSFAGEVPHWIGELTRLEFLDLSDNRFSGEVPDSIGEIMTLKELKLSGNSFTGSLPESMAGCKSLLDVDFSRNSFTGGLPSWLFQSTLQRVLISENKLSDSLKISMMNHSTISVLDLSGNTFSGVIPAEISSIQSLQLLNLSHNSLSGQIHTSIGELKSLEVIDLSHNLLNGSIPLEIGKAISLKALYLSQNNLTGSLPLTLVNSTNLQIIDLSHNKLSGTLPKQLSDLPHLHSFNISHNLFSGALPAGHFFDTIPLSSLSDNPGLCGSAVHRACPAVLPKPIVLNPNSSSSNNSNPKTSPENLGHKKTILSISTLIAIGAAAVIAVGVIGITVLNLRVRSMAPHSAAAMALFDDNVSGSPTTEANSGKLVMFSGEPEFSAGAHAVLNKDCELGRGGFGTVYKTTLKDGRPVAIKKLTVSSMVKSQEEFEKVVKKLAKIRHPNLVALEGYYWTSSLQLLIYEFLSGGSLYKHLHENSASNTLSWGERFNTILGVARSLAHLHQLNIIHYNLKSSNVLIDGTGVPKVGDYGLAKLLPMLDRYVISSKIQSALGYMAPEFACRTVKITEKCDVYAFGVLVLEIVTGRRPVEYMEDDVVVLCDVIRQAMEEGKADEFVDGKLRGCVREEEMVPVIKLGLICTSQVPSNRPEMSEDGMKNKARFKGGEMEEHGKRGKARESEEEEEEEELVGHFHSPSRSPTRQELDAPQTAKSEIQEVNTSKVVNFDVEKEEEQVNCGVNGLDDVNYEEKSNEMPTKLMESGRSSSRLHVGDLVKKVMSLPTEERVKVLDLLECDYRLLTVSDYNDILTALVKAREYDSAVDLFSELPGQGVSPDSWTFSVMIQCLCKKNEPDEARQTLDEMMERGFVPNVVTFTELISCLCKRGRITKAFEVFELMRRIGCEPTVRTYNCLINGLCYVGRVEEALELLRKIKKSPKRPDIYSFTLVMDGFCKVGRSDEARELLTESLEMGLVPNVVTYNSLIGGYCTEGRPLEGLRILKEMGGSCPPDFSTYNILLQGLLRFGEISAAFETYMKMHSMGFQASERVMNTLLRGLCRQSTRNGDSFKKAKELFEKITELHYPLSPYTYCRMVQALAERGEVSQAFNHLLKMIGNGYSPRMLTYNIVLRVLCMNGRVDDALYVLVLMLEKDTIPGRFSFSVLIDELERQGRLLDAYGVYGSAVKWGVIPKRKPRQDQNDGKEPLHSIQGDECKN